MKQAPISTAVAVLVGLVVLLGAFFVIPGLQPVNAMLLDWAVILAGVATAVSVLYLIFGVHWKNLSKTPQNRWYSVALIMAFLATATTGFLLGLDNPDFQRVVTSIQMPVEASLMGVLAITLIVASFRLLKRRSRLMGIIFFIAVIVFLVANSGLVALFSGEPLIKELLSAIHILPDAGARGLLLGIALGSLMAGIRIFLGSDRPYSR